ELSFTISAFEKFILKRIKNKIDKGQITNFNQKKFEMEKRIVRTILITISGFMLTWTPYAILFFLLAFYPNQFIISPILTFLCACFAKSSVMWIPILYLTTSTYFQCSFINQNYLQTQIQNKKTFTPID
ncbi:hypothetical protein I4U23_005761, partial [Adineta vaga]